MSDSNVPDGFETWYGGPQPHHEIGEPVSFGRSVWDDCFAAWQAGIKAERERFADVLNMARICAENNYKRTDDCGELARKLLAALNELKV